MEYGSALPAGFRHVPFWAKTELEKNPFALLDLRPGARVMDCGAHVGMFAAAALEQGASFVRCYEPAPKNAEYARENLSRYGTRAEVVEAALVSGTSSPTVTLCLSGFDGAHQLGLVRENLGKPPAPNSITVRAVGFREELLAVSPTVLKLDVEGAEYDLIDSFSPGDLRGVESLFVEFHPARDRTERFARARAYVEREGLTVVSDRLRTFTATRGSR